MIPITKWPEPDGLAPLRQQAAELGLSPKEAYDTLQGDLEKSVRNALVMEQGGLCAYCMCQIPRRDAGKQPPIIIEHFVARDPADGRDVGQGLDYNNLLAVCHGNRGDAGTRTLDDLVCDAHRGNTEFRKINPLVPETLSSICYSTDGKIDAGDPDVRSDLVDTLNLNCPTAPQLAERKEMLDTLLNDIGACPEEELADYCTNILNSYLAETNPKTRYVGILIWYLQSLLEGLSAEQGE